MVRFRLILYFSSAQRLADWFDVVGRTVRDAPSNIQNHVIVCSFPAIHIPPYAAVQLALINVQLKPHLSYHDWIGAISSRSVRVSPKPLAGLTAARDHNPPSLLLRFASPVSPILVFTLHTRNPADSPLSRPEPRNPLILYNDATGRYTLPSIEQSF